MSTLPTAPVACQGVVCGDMKCCSSTSCTDQQEHTACNMVKCNYQHAEHVLFSVGACVVDLNVGRVSRMMSLLYLHTHVVSKSGQTVMVGRKLTHSLCNKKTPLFEDGQGLYDQSMLQASFISRSACFGHPSALVLLHSP